MSSIHIRDVAPETLRALKRLARSNRRSLQGELHVILARAAEMAPPDTPPVPLNLVTVRTGRAARWNREDVYGPSGR